MHLEVTNCKFAILLLEEKLVKHLVSKEAFFIDGLYNINNYLNNFGI